MWFSFDGETFEVHSTEQDARATAELAMEFWQDNAADGWDELSTQVCFGKVTHAVRVEPIEITDDNRYLVPPGCDGAESHCLEPVVVPRNYRWEQCYELGDEVHWAIVDDESAVPQRKVEQPKPQEPIPIARLGATELSFGQYADRCLDDIPLEYLEWLLRTQEDFHKTLRAYLTHPELESRRRGLE